MLCTARNKSFPCDGGGGGSGVDVVLGRLEESETWLDVTSRLVAHRSQQIYFLLRLGVEWVLTVQGWANELDSFTLRWDEHHARYVRLVVESLTIEEKF